MTYMSPELSDDLIMSRVRRPGGPAVNDPTGLMAGHALRQAEDSRYTEMAGKQIGLGEKRIAEGKRQFDTGLAIAKDQNQYARRQGNLATGISALGFGVSALDDIEANKRLNERIKITNDMIGQLKQRGDSNSLFVANMLKYLQVQ